MDASIATIKASCHSRSSSLPSRSHPLIVSVEDQLSKLRASEAATSSSPSIVCQNLASLKELYECVNNVLQLPLTQQAFSHEQQEKFIENALDGSLRLLDMCGTTRDVFSEMKGCVQDLESSLRRRNCQESNISKEIEKYIFSRKKMNKTVYKIFNDVKRMLKSNMVVLEKDNDHVALVGMLREVEAVSVTVFKFLLSLVCPPKAGWSKISKLIGSKRVSCEEEDKDVTKLDDLLDSVIRNKSSKGIGFVQMQKAQKGLEASESNMQELEEGLACAFRCLIKTRVSLLNILNH